MGRLARSAHGDVGELATAAIGEEVDAVDRRALGAVHGDRVGVVEVLGVRGLAAQLDLAAGVAAHNDAGVVHCDDNSKLAPANNWGRHPTTPQTLCYGARPWDGGGTRMLQIATGMYFDDGPLYETTHRGVYYSNATALRADAIELPFGRLLFASGFGAVTPITIEAVDRLPKVGADGTGSFMVATGGSELLDDAATVFGFWANVTCSRHLSVVERLVPRSSERSPSRHAATILRRTFDPQVMILPDQFDELRQFCVELLALERRHYEAGMRAMRKVTAACTMVSEDPALSYALFVSALESLAQVVTTPADFLDWDRYDSKKRTILDAALSELDSATAESVRDAILRADQLALGRRFKTFVLDHIEPAFFRAESEGVLRPIRAHDLAHALEVAYRLRSRNVHELRDLEPELWVIADRADTLRWESRSVLSLEGLNRLCRHVIREFIRRSPTGRDETFDFRSHLPGIVRMQWAPQYWVGQADGYTTSSAPSYLLGFVELLCPLLLNEGLTLEANLTQVLERVEELLLAEKKESARRPMLALYVLWQHVMAEDLRRPDAAKLIDRFEADLDGPSVESFTVRILLDGPIEWTVDEVETLVRGRRADLERGRGQELPPRLDAALLLFFARSLSEAGRLPEAREYLAAAVESLPGNETLIQLEESVTDEGFPAFELRRLALGGDDWLLTSPSVEVPD